MSGHNSSNLEKRRQQLEALANRVRTNTDQMIEEVRQSSGGNAESELSNVPFHLGDMGTEEFLYDMNATLLANEQYIAQEARDALDRIDKGTYGICESCGKRIAKLRLDAIPFARFCVECAARNDAPQVNVDEGRPRRPDDTLAPEGEMQEDRIRRDNALESPRPPVHRGDVHAVGTAGGGTAVGGLAGTNEGHGDPSVLEVDEATASSNFDAEDDRDTEGRTPRSGPSGGAVGGTPAFKRTN